MTIARKKRKKCILSTDGNTLILCQGTESTFLKQCGKNVDALKISSEALDEMIDGAVRWAEHFQTECSARPVN